MQTLPLSPQGHEGKHQSEVTGVSTIYSNFGFWIFDFGMMVFQQYLICPSIYYLSFLKTLSVTYIDSMSKSKIENPKSKIFWL